MSDRWVVDQDHPQGHLVPMTPAEQAQFDADQAAAATASASAATVASNRGSIAQAAQTRLAQIRTARTALTNGTIFAAFSASEKAVIDGLLQDDLLLIRLGINLYDGTN